VLRVATLDRVQEVMGGEVELDFGLLDVELLWETEFVLNTECLLLVVELLLGIDVADKLIVLFVEDLLVFGGVVVLTVLVPLKTSVVVELADHCKNPESALLHQAIFWGIQQYLGAFEYFDPPK
jgi:hypothetical protein